MKTEIVNGREVVVVKTRGMGDGGVALRYLADNGDGTYSHVSEWYSDPAVADKVYEAATDAAHLDWVAKEADRLTVAPEERPVQEARPEPVALKDATVEVEATIRAK